jgi:hypothetical protein
MKLFCWIIDKSESSFSVDVANGGTVDDLKDAIVKKKPFALNGLDADQLTLWKVSDLLQHRLFHALFTLYKVSIEITKDLKNQVSKYQLVDDDYLLESNILSEAFPEPLQGYLHVVVRIPFVGEYSRH